MNARRLLPLFFALLFPALAQNSPPTPGVSSPDLKKEVAAVDAAWQYCGAIDRFIAANRPVLFARESAGWRRFTKAEWAQAGGPFPAALVWLRGGRTIAAKFASSEAAGNSPVTYYFWENGNLARISVKSRYVQEGSAARSYRTLAVGWQQLSREDGSGKLGAVMRIPECGQKVYIENGEGEPGRVMSVPHCRQDWWAERMYDMRPTAPQFLTVLELPFVSLLYFGA